MNKDVIYIEPEDDITDIILKIENSKEKIIALVPPKKAGVFRSVVNIKLIAKAGLTSKKKIVLVTTDPSIKKIAATTKIPVAKNLQSAPVIPVLEEENESSSEELLNESDDDKATDTSDGEDNKGDDESEDGDNVGDKNKDDKDSTDEDEDEDEKKSSKSLKNALGKKVKQGKGNASGLIGWIKSNKKMAAILGVCGVVLLIFLIWAFAIAPSVTVKVGIRTDLHNFSENVNFSTKLDAEDMETGTFYLETKKVESSQEVKFEATGKKNIGEKASGQVEVYAYFPLNVPASTQIKEGETFTISGLSYIASKAVTLEYNGKGKDDCANKSNSEGLVDYGCRINGVVPVVASEPGTKYNIAASSSGWDTNARVFAYSSKDITGGTDQEITLVTKADVEKAKSELAAVDQDKNKEELLEKIGDDNLVIDSSFTQKTSDATSVPAIGEEVKEGVTPVLKATTVASIYVLDKTKVEEFITAKANLSESQKIYEMKNPFIESFLETTSGYTGKLKTSYAVGPRITENSVIDIIKGKGLGEAQHDLRDISGISEVVIDKSVPWVTSIPNNPNKITIIFDIKDQNGNKIEIKQESTDEQDKNDSSNSESQAEDDSKQ